jgi:hypothetical protein
MLTTAGFWMTVLLTTLAKFELKFREHLRRLFVITHVNEGAMT